MKIQDEIDVLIRARYPIIYLISSEEMRVQETLLDVARSHEKKVFEWSSSQGMVPAGTSIQSLKARHPQTRDPLAALDHVIESVEPAIFVFKDFHVYLTKGNPLVIRRLKEIALHLKNSHKTILLISPILEIPPELEKEITILNFPLPNAAEISALLDRVTQEVHRFPHVTIDLNGSARERLVQAAMGLTLTEAENIFARIIVERERLSISEIEAVLEEKQQIVRKSGLLEYYSAEEGFAEVGGLGLLKEWLMKRSVAFTEEARKFGLPAPKGVLILGMQGCGKSLCAKAVSRLWRLPLLRFDMGRMFGSLVGSSEENMRRAIAVAQSVAPAILWVDEIDKAFAGAGGSGSVDSGTTARVFGTFLTWLSEKTKPVFVVATANNISHLPPELLRKGRFDEIFFVDLPSARERLEIFQIHLRKRSRRPEAFDLTALSEASEGFSGAEIEEVVVSGLYDAFDEKKELCDRHLREALNQTIPLSRTMDGSMEELRDWSSGRTRRASG